MFIEVYVIPTKDWNNDPETCKIPENKRLINTNHVITVKESTRCSKRAELWLIENTYNKVLTVVGTYEQILARINQCLATNSVARVA